MPPSDDELIRSFQDGQTKAFDELLVSHRDGLLRLAGRWGLDEESALDIAQEAFLAAWQKLPQWTEGASFRTWLYRVALNQIRTHHRRAVGLERRKAAAPIRELPGSDLLEAQLQQEDLRQIRDAMQALPEQQLTALSLRFDSGLSYREIGEVLGITEEGARTSAYRAVQGLRKAVHPAE